MVPQDPQSVAPQDFRNVDEDFQDMAEDFHADAQKDFLSVPPQDF